MHLTDSFTQIVMVGFLAFCGPGLFNALNAVGGAGSPSRETAAVGNGTLYAVFALVSYFSGVLFNLLGPKPLFFVGGLCYSVYSLCVFYTTPQRVWLAAIGGAVLGAGAGIFWTAQGAVMMAYSVESNRGHYIAIFWLIFNLGGVFGGLLSFGLNVAPSDSQGFGPISYFTFIAVMTLSAFCSLCLLVNPSKIVKDDGASVIFEKATSARKELRAAVRGMKDPLVVKMLLFFFSSNWFYAYEFNGYNGHQFSLRTRGFNSAAFWASQMVGSFITGKILDNCYQSLRQRARLGFYWNFVLMILSYSMAMIAQYSSCGGEWDKGRKCHLDLADIRRSAFPILTFCVMGMSDAVYQSYAYWIMAAVASNDVKKSVQLSACYKSVQSLGGSVSWLLDLIDVFTYRIQVITCLALCTFSVLPVLVVIPYFPSRVPLSPNKSINTEDVPTTEDEKSPIVGV